MAGILASLASAFAPTIVETLGNLGKSALTTVGQIGKNKIENYG